MPNLPERQEGPRSFVVELGTDNMPRTPAERDKLIERFNDNPELEKPVTHLGQILVTSPSAERPKITLPVSHETFLHPANWKKGASQAISWLLILVKRIMQKNPDNTIFNK
jgi:hypothetical protein